MKKRIFSLLYVGAVVMICGMAFPTYAEDDVIVPSPESVTETPIETPVETPDDQTEIPAESDDQTQIPEETPDDQTQIPEEIPTETPVETPAEIPEEIPSDAADDPPPVSEDILETLDQAPTSSLTYFTLHIRYEDKLLYEGAVPIPTSDVDVTDSAGLTHTISATSLLAALTQIDTEQDNFSISKLTYYDSFGAFFISCITVLDLAAPACDNWVFVVNDVFPFSSVDQQQIESGDDVYLFFGSQLRARANAETYSMNSPITGYAEKYNYKTGLWESTTSVTLSIIKDNPENMWSPIVVTSSPANELGQASFIIDTTGTYKMGIDEDYYIHTDSFEIVEIISETTTSTESATSTPTSTPDTSASTSTPSTGNDPGDTSNGGGTNSESAAPPELVSDSIISATIEKVLAYIRSQQKNTGMIVDGATTDWLIMTFGAQGMYADDIALSQTSLLDFALEYNFTSQTELNVCAGYSRHVLALLAAGVPTDHEKVIETMGKVKSGECVSGGTYGESGINDDIFALFSLLATGEPASDSLVNMLVTSIKKDQTSNGAFTWDGWEGPDVTGAAINALKYATKKGIAVDSAVFTKAKEYLKHEQLADGGWGFGSSDVLTTSWAIMGINALSESQADWVHTGGKNPWHVLTSNLSPQGYYTSPFTGSKPDWFALKHAIPALEGASWPIILSPHTSNGSSDNGCSSCSIADETTPTTTTPTSTPSLPDNSTTSTPSLLDIVIGIDPELFGVTSSTEPANEPVIKEEIAENIVEAETPVNLDNQEDALPSGETISEAVPGSRDGVRAENTEARSIRETTTLNTEPEETTAAGANPQDGDTNAGSEIVETQYTNSDSLGKKIAERVFNSAAAGTAGLGLFLAWRFARTLL